MHCGLCSFIINLMESVVHPTMWQTVGVDHLMVCPVWIFREDFAMKIFLRPFFLFRWFKKSSCQLMVKECMLSTGKLPLGGLPRNSVVWITERPNITSAVYSGGKATIQTILSHLNVHMVIFLLFKVNSNML